MSFPASHIDEMADCNLKEEFTVVSSAEELRVAARVGDLNEAKAIIARYQGSLSKFLPAVLSAVDDLSGNCALHLCCANGHLNIVRLLLEHNAPTNVKNLSGSTALHYASLTGQLEVVKELIKNGAEPVVENNGGRTALDEAFSGKHEKVAKFLLAHVDSVGCNPDLKEDTEEGLMKLNQDVRLSNDGKE